jgi:4-methyl-5(b-hydroxyethyl)-thiazole monophosphate biosynthesis
MEIIIVDELLVQDSGVITSTSPATAVDVAFTLLEELTSRDNALTVRIWAGFK